MRYGTKHSVGTTLIEVLITLSIVSLILSGNFAVYLHALQWQHKILQSAERIFANRAADQHDDNVGDYWSMFALHD